MPKIGIAITTKNRPEAFQKCLIAHDTYRPDDCRIFVVDDGSHPYCYADYDVRNIHSKGISASKNKCLELLMDAGCEHLFLFDDDAYPICKDWHLPYINSGEHHLCRTFYKPYRTDGNLNLFRLSNGCAMYFTRHCVETVGGFDTAFNNKYEHCQLSHRIHNFGLTRHVHQDIIGSDKLIYCLDEHNEVERTATKKEMNQSLKDGYDHFMKTKNQKLYIPFR